MCCLGGLYDLVASMLSPSTDHRLHTYTILTTNKPNRLLIANKTSEAELFDQQNNFAGLFDLVRHYVLVFDSMSCKGSFVADYH